MGKYGLKGDMAEGFRALQLAVKNRNFQEGLLAALPRSGLLEHGMQPTASLRSAAADAHVCAGHGTELVRWKSSHQVNAEPKDRERARALS
jgi:hypothetical protein